MTDRQPLAARVWGSAYRTWFQSEGRQRKKAKRRSARREHMKARRDMVRE